VVLVGLAAIPIAYMAARASGLWDGGILVKMAGPTGRAGTVLFRLQAEDQIIRRVLDRNPAFGFGNYVWHGQLGAWPDGSWLHVLWMGGLVGLGLQLIALHVLPAALALSKPLGRPDQRQATSPAWGLAAWCILLMVDSLHNTSYFTPSALIVGTLVGTFLSRESVGVATLTDDRDSDRARSVVPGPLILVAILLVAIEFIGHLPRTPALQPSSPTPENRLPKDSLPHP